MLYCRAQCFCTVLCPPSLIWLDANKTCFHQPGALLGSHHHIFLFRWESPWFRAWESKWRPICRRPPICLHTGKILYCWRQTEAKGCYAGMALVQDNLVDHVKLLWRQGILSTLWTISNSAAAFSFEVFSKEKCCLLFSDCFQGSQYMKGD